jgi:enoyl-CoA hydratase/carnithine racemase
MSDILQHQDDGVLTLTLNRVEKKNALTAAMYADLALALSGAATDPGVRVALIQGHETVFSAGNDLADFMNQPPQGTDSSVFRFLSAISSFPKPLLAAVSGPAVGIGSTLLLHCDLVVAGDNAAFSMPFVNLGLCPEAASSLLVPQLMGYHRAAEALMLGEPFMAEAALDAGWVNRVVPPTEANAVAQQWARKLSQKPMAALMETKRLLKSGQADSVAMRMAQEGEMFRRMLHEPAAKEAFAAFFEKRRPDFSKVNAA